MTDRDAMTETDRMRSELVGADECGPEEAAAMTDDEVRSAHFAAFYVDEGGYA